MKVFFLLIIAPCFFILLSCSNGSLATLQSATTDDSNTDPGNVDPNAFTKTTLSSSSWTTLTRGPQPYHLVKAQTGTRNPTFMQWLPNGVGTPTGAVILYYPYEGIDWSGLAIDTKWATRSGGQNDEDGPDYNVSTSSQISYVLMAPGDATSYASYLAANDLNVLIVYGRYYSGTNLSGDAQAVADGLKFLHSQTLVDKTKIGLYSGSWGGIGTLYGAALAGATYMPKAISLSYPVSDAKAMIAYAANIPNLTADTNKRAAYAAFFDPYLRRINKATEALAGQATRYDAYSQTALSGITSDMFIIHDDWDTLVPASLTTSLFSAVASTNKILYSQKHTTAINYSTFDLGHNQTTQNINYATTLTWNYLYLITELVDPGTTRVAAYHSPDMVAQFTYMVSMHTAGQNTSSFNKVLGLLCLPNLFMKDTTGANPDTSASNVLVVLMSNLYQSGWAPDGPAACAKLITNPPF
jgi:esterase/lipase